MTRSDQEERFRILAIKVKRAYDRLHDIECTNTFGLSEAEHTLLGAELSMARVDYMRAQIEQNTEINRAAGLGY